MNPRTESTPATTPPRKKPCLALAIATVFGIGYMPKAPGTFGSIVGCFVTISSVFVFLPVLAILPTMPRRWLVAFGVWLYHFPTVAQAPEFWFGTVPTIGGLIVIAALGVWAASKVSRYAEKEDPQYVVIDEVSGQQLTFLLGLFPFFLPAVVVKNPDFMGYCFLFAEKLLNWKCLLLGFILFRVFDIWKPYPIRLLEKLPGGWGIMADDWMAGVYAAIVLRLALHLGLV